MTAPREIIETIRRTKFFIGVQLPPEAQSGVDDLRKMTHRLLEIVSKDLYAREAHFVLELVQNADDNQYPPGSCPQISFALRPNQIVVTNNEMGFGPDNVRALCSAGESTKRALSGTIGEKGIGFKSVFAVSDRPEIHSNGFHFRFDASRGEMLGYIVPEWIDGQVDEVGTRIILPAKQGCYFTSDALTEVSAALLLFLRRLRQLSITNEISETTLCAVRSDEGSRVALTTTRRITSKPDASQSTERFLRVEHVVPMTDIAEDKRPNIDHTNLILAFPLNDDGTARADSSPSVYAFLPIRSVGFKFIVQADFVLSSSREDIHQDRPWNVRLRDEIAPAFAAAVSHLKSDEKLARTFFDYVPSFFDVTDSFFDQACEPIAARLRSTDCVQARSGAWCTPSQILLADAGFQSLFSNDDILQVLQLEYPAQNFTPSARTTLSGLGAESLALSHVLSMLEDEERLAGRSANWFSALYEYLARTYTSDQALKKLGPLGIVRLSGGALASGFHSEIFFPLGGGKRYGFEGDLSIVDAAVLTGPKERAARVREFLRKLDVHEASPYKLIDSHILPQHAGDAWETSDLDTLAGHIAYIKDHLRQYLEGSNTAGVGAAQAIERLRSGLYVRSTECGEGTTIFYRPHSLHLPKEYEPEVDLEGLFGPAVTGTPFVSPTFIERSAADQPASQEAIAEWRNFFYRIGVNRIPAITQSQVGTTINYLAGPTLQKMLACDEPTKINAAIRVVDAHWSSYYCQFKSRRHVSGIVHGMASTFVDTLRKTLVPTTKGRRLPLGEAFLESDAVKVVFGRSPAYLTVPLSDPDFMDAVGITHRIDAGACIRRLDRLRQSEHVSVTEVRTLYKALERRLEVEESTVLAELTAHPRIYVPALKDWFSTTGVVWYSSGPFLDLLYPPLAHAYPEHKAFLCKYLSVAARPAEEALVSALKELPQFDIELERQQREAYSILRTLSESLHEARQSDPSFTPAWLERLRNDELFLDHFGRLVKVDNDLYIDDDPRLAEVFRDVKQVSFLPIDRARLPVIRNLLEACGIPTLSEAVRFERPSVRDEITDREVSALIRRRRAAISRLLYHRDHSAFEYAFEIGAWDRLAQLEVRRVADLTVDVHLAAHSALFSPDILRDDNIIYLRHDTRAARDKLCVELCALLGARSDVADALFRVLFAADSELEEFFESKGISEIPAEELARTRQRRNEEVVGDSGPESSVEAPETVPTETVDEREQALLDASGFSNMPVGPVTELPSMQSPSSAPATVTPLPTNSPVGQTRSGDFTDPYRHDGGGRAHDGESSERSSLSRPFRRAERPGASGRLLSYVEPQPQATEHDRMEESEDGDLRRQLAAAAVSFVIECERGEGYQVEEMAFNNEGFDLQRIGPDGSREYIEVKGQAGLWTEAGIVMTPGELRYAERFRERYFLYVVEFAGHPERRTLHRIQDPFGKVMQFRFDSGWKAVAVTADNLEPAEGLRIELDEGVGTIISARRAGQFFSLQVGLGDDPPKSMLFIPGKMRLLRP